MAGMMKVSGGRTNKRRGSHGFSEINVTPLVDVMLVLLVIFMISAPMLTVGVPLDLPKTKAAQLSDQIDPVVVSVDASGNVFLQETPVDSGVLIERLMVVTQNNPDARVFVRGDANLSYGRIMEVMGEISSSGFTKVSLLAEMPTSAKPSAPKPTLAPSSHPAQVQTAPAVAPAQNAPLPTLQTLMPPQGKPQAVPVAAQRNVAAPQQKVSRQQPAKVLPTRSTQQVASGKQR